MTSVTQRNSNKRQVVGERRVARTSSRSKKAGGGFVSIPSTTMTNLLVLLPRTPAIITKRFEAASTDVIGGGRSDMLAAGVATDMDPNKKESKTSSRSRLSLGAMKISKNAASLISILYLFSIIFTVYCDHAKGAEGKMIEELPIKGQDDETMSPLLLGCSEIGQLPIIDIIGKGKQKIGYKVQLPSGEHALAKRCISLNCVKESLVKKEATILKHLQEQYGRHQTIEIFGECEGSKWSFPHLNNEDIEKSANDFNIGYTSIIALAEPLLSEWKQGVSFGKRRKCFASHFTDEDIEGFKTIARQYANYSKYPLTLEDYAGKKLKHGFNSDNKYAENYLLTKAGIRHGDLDCLYPCEECSYEEALQINCASVSNVAKIPLNCSTSLPNETLQIKDGHINHIKAESYCWGLKENKLRAQY